MPLPKSSRIRVANGYPVPCVFVGGEGAPFFEDQANGVAPLGPWAREWD